MSHDGVLSLKMPLDSRWVLAGLLAALLGTLAGAPTGAEPNPFDQNVAPLQIGDPMPAIALVDQHGEPFTFALARGQTTLVGFIYTRCDDVCPLITQKFGQLDRLLGAGPYRLVEVTIDPAYDRPAVLEAYAKKYGVTGHRWSIVTGDPGSVQTFTRSAGLAVIANGRGELVHNARLLIVSPDGRLDDVVQLAAWEPATIAAQLEHVAGTGSNPIARADLALTKTVAQFCGGSFQAASGVIDVVAGVLVLAGGIVALLWIRKRLFAQGA